MGAVQQAHTSLTCTSLRTSFYAAEIAGKHRKMAIRALLVGCLSATSLVPSLQEGSAAEPVKSLIELRTEGVVVQKFDLSCGAAALATLLNFQFGDRVTEKQVTEGLIQRKEYIDNPLVVRVRQGFSLLDLKRYVDRRGYQGVGYGNLELNDLKDLAPIIVAVSPLGYNHFLVYRGQSADKVLLADPAFGNRTMSVEKFLRIWIEFPEIGRVGFIVTRNGNPAPPGLLAAQLQRIVAPPNSFVRQVFPH
jgi:predicted double-glycine peptidase